ncbi:MAPEG family protein [Aquabacterium sp. A3]|uniref:MAPEG family protein n=1 Tax=Aquabacterium sp. A3 TaxID=3132829 RepID=UPI00311A6BE6
MTQTTILWPLLALAAWTSLVLLLIPVVRIRAGLKGEIRPDDFKYGESAQVPPHVSLPNRNYMNLLELPMLFYVVGLMLYVTNGQTPITQTLAWAYVGLRIAHSMVHLSYNHVIHRLVVFAASNLVLVILWMLAAQHVLSLP